MPTIDPKDLPDFKKFVAEYEVEKFRQAELKRRLIKFLIFAGIILLCAASEMVGYYWGNL